MRSQTLRLLAFAAPLLAFAADARVIHVPAEQPTIAAGIAAAVRGDIVQIACGTYFERNLHMKSGITVRGATGEAACVVIDAQNLGRGFLVSNCDATTAFEGITLKSCTASLDNGRGGGMWIVDASPAIRNCNFQSCVGSTGGGVHVHQASSSPVFTECKFLSCTGGAMYVNTSTNVTVHRGLFSGTGSGVMVTTAGLLRISRSSFVTAGSVGQSGNNPRLHVDRCMFFTTTANVDSASCCVTNSSFTSVWSQNIITGNALPCGTTGTVATNSPCLVASGPCAGIIGYSGAGCGPSPPVPITVTTSVPGKLVRVDGVDYTTPAVFSWYPMSEHRVSIDSTFAQESSTRWRFASWSDGGERSHYFVLTPGTTSLVAEVRKQYKVKTMVISESPGVGGSIVPADAWADEGVPFELHAAPNPGSVFRSWLGQGAGSYTGESNPAVLTLYNTVTQRARFAGLGYEFSISASDTDPAMNEAAPTGGLRGLTLWLTCSRGGLSAFEAAVTGSLPFLAFVPAAGVLNAGSGNHLLLAVENCPSGSSLTMPLGTIYVTDTGGAVCLGAWEGSPVGAVDCAVPSPNYAPNPGVTGFASSGSACRVGTRTCESTAPPVGRPTAATTGSVDVAFAIDATRPNPFTGQCEVTFSLPDARKTSVAVFDVVGRRVARLLDAALEPGSHRVVWNGADENGERSSAGVYFVRVQSGVESRTVRVVRLDAGR